MITSDGGQYGLVLRLGCLGRVEVSVEFLEVGQTLGSRGSRHDGEFREGLPDLRSTDHVGQLLFLCLLLVHLFVPFQLVQCLLFEQPIDHRFVAHDVQEGLFIGRRGTCRFITKRVPLFELHWHEKCRNEFDWMWS